MKDRSIFYGWWVVAAFSVMTFTSTGIRHAVGPFLKPIVGDLGLDRASFSLVIALSLFLYGVFMPLAGIALDRFSVRFVSSVGTILLVISLVLTAMVRNVWEFALVYGVLVQINFAHADIVTLGAFSAYFFVHGFGGGYIASIAVALAVGGALGFIMNAAIFAPLQSRGSELLPLIATIGVSITMENAMLAWFGPISCELMSW